MAWVSAHHAAIRALRTQVRAAINSRLLPVGALAMATS